MSKNKKNKYDRAEVKAQIFKDSPLQAYMAKMDLILRKKGKNGQSMTPVLYKRHADAHLALAPE